MSGSIARLLPLRVPAGAPISLPPGRPTTIGRDPDSTLPLAEDDISRRHARLEPAKDGWIVRDLDSANGTWVNGKRTAEKRLRHGDEIRFGESSRFRYLDGRPEPAWRGWLRSLRRHELIARDESFTPRRTPIGSSPHIIGRGEEADVRIALPQISDPHARVEARGGLPLVHDHQSRNGTRVNGDSVDERVLRPGDEVSFADRPFDVKILPTPSARGLFATAALAGVVGLAALGSVWIGRDASGLETLWTREMYEEQAERSVSDALAALDRSPPASEVALARFEIAVRSLIASDRLPPETPTLDQIRAAFAAIVGTDVDGQDPGALYASLRRADDEAARAEAIRAEAPPEPPQSPDPLEPEAAPSDAPVDRAGIVETELSFILAEFGIDTEEQPIPDELLAEVVHFVDFWTNDLRTYTVRSLARAAPHLPKIRREMRRAHLPVVFSCLPFVESGYRMSVSSPAGARGMWQFMPKTARSFGLRVDDTHDDRTDPVLATRAACDYLGGLLSAFGADAFMCAVAAYNKGEYGMVTCLKRINWRSRWKFWELVQRNDGCLRQETIEYVPRFLAAAIVMRRPEAFGLDLASEAGS